MFFIIGISRDTGGTKLGLPYKIKIAIVKNIIYRNALVS